ncbi:MAG: hypothetical protein NW241_15585 [Bacteroidia bacterium]|nr:hypothetical protein [Bacteroidia bacterium]
MAQHDSATGASGYAPELLRMIRAALEADDGPQAEAMLEAAYETLLGEEAETICRTEEYRFLSLLLCTLRLSDAQLGLLADLLLEEAMLHQQQGRQAAAVDRLKKALDLQVFLNTQDTGLYSLHRMSRIGYLQALIQVLQEASDQRGSSAYKA